MLKHLLTTLLLSCTTTVPTVAQDTLSILFTGDVLLDRGLRPLIDRRGTEHLFEGVSKAFRRSDAVVINLECPITDSRSPVNKQFVFRADTACAEGLRRAGVTHAAMANNHTNDQGRQGLHDTHRHLTAAGITPLGYGLTKNEQLLPTLIRNKGIEVAIFNAVLFPLENWQPTDEEKPDICQTDINILSGAMNHWHKKNPNIPIVAILHWGTEFQCIPHISQRISALQLIKSGANAIIGHHPHVIQKMEYAGNVPIYYSLGNFVFDQKHPDACRSVIAVLHFTADKGLVRTETIPVNIKQGRPHILK